MRHLLCSVSPPNEGGIDRFKITANGAVGMVHIALVIVRQPNFWICASSFLLLVKFSFGQIMIHTYIKMGSIVEVYIQWIRFGESLQFLSIPVLQYQSILQDFFESKCTPKYLTVCTSWISAPDEVGSMYCQLTFLVNVTSTVFLRFTGVPYQLCVTMLMRTPLCRPRAIREELGLIPLGMPKASCLNGPLSSLFQISPF